MFESRFRRRTGLFAASLICAAILALALATTGATPAAADSDSHSDDHSTEHEVQFAVLSDGEWFKVTVDFYLSDTATDADVAAAAEEVSTRFAGFERTSESAVSAQFATSGPTWPGNTLTWQYNPAGKPGALADGFAELSAAATTWNTAGANWTFVSGGRTSAGTSGCGAETDGQNTFGWHDQPGGVLAITCTWSRPQDGGGEIFVEADMEFDPDWNWTTGTSSVSTDFQSIAVHEMGHALGLAHTSASCPGTVMCSWYAEGVIIRTLTADDLAGLFAIYGSSTGNPPNAAQPQQRGSYRIVAPMTSRN